MNTETLLDHFRIHLLSAGRGAGTIRIRLGYLRQFARANPDLLAVTRHDLEAFMAERRESHKAETRASIRTALKLFYAWAHEEGHIAADPASRLAPVRKTATVPRVALDDDIKTALQAASPRDRAIILLARFGCLRRAEIAGLRVRDRQGSQLRVLGKGEKQRRVTVNPQLMEALLALEADGRTFYFPGDRGGHIDGETVHYVITKLTNWNPHALRHAGATAAYRETKNIVAVQEMLGHSSVATTQRYVHVDEEALAEVAAATATGFDDAA